MNDSGDDTADNDVNTLSTAFNRVSVKPEAAQKRDYVKEAVKGTGVYWLDIARRPTFHTLQYGTDFKNWVTEEVNRRQSNINPSSSFSSRSIGGIFKGGKKSRRNTRRRKNSKKQKRVRHTRRKQTRRHRHRRSRHRR
jgi:hypothetical protein